MKIKVYLDCENAEVLTKTEYNKLMESINEEREERIKQLLHDRNRFDSFLGYYYNCYELWDMTEEKRTEILNSFLEYCKEEADDSVDSPDIEECIIEVNSEDIEED